MGKTKSELVRSITFSKIPMEEILKRLKRTKGHRNIPLDKLLSQEDSPRQIRLGVQSGMQGSKILFDGDFMKRITN